MHAHAGDFRRSVQARVRVKQVNLHSYSEISALASDDLVLEGPGEQKGAEVGLPYQSEAPP